MQRETESIHLTIQAPDVITPKCLSTVVNSIIKYILFNCRQIPFNYECLESFVKMYRIPDTGNSRTFNWDIDRAERFYKLMLSTFENLESTFQVIETELHKGIGVEEIALVLGPTILTPSHIFRISVPRLGYEHNPQNHSVAKVMGAIFQTLVDSNSFNRVLERSIRPTRIYVLLKMASGYSVNANIFVPIDNFRLRSTSPQVLFSFISSTSHECDCPNELHAFKMYNTSQLCSEMYHLNIYPEKDTASSKLATNNDYNGNWYVIKEPLLGFIEVKIKGKSAFDYLEIIN